jgi:hypothetical protein
LPPSQPSLNAPFSLFQLLAGNSIDARRPVVAAHARHRRFQYICPIDPVVQRVKPELRFLLGLLVSGLPVGACFASIGQVSVSVQKVYPAARFRSAVLP